MYLSEKIEEIELSEILEEKILFPFIFAIYFVLSVYEHNIGQVFFTDTLLPLGIILVGTYTAYYILNYLIDNKKKAGLKTFIFMIAGFTYGLQVDLLLTDRSLEILGAELASGRYLIVFNLFAASILSFAIYKLDSNLRNVVEIANTVTSFLLLIVLFNIILFQTGVTGAELDKSLSVNSTSTEEPPTIYYIVPDRYGRNDILEEQYNFNNSNFTSSLQNQGFYIGEESYANYPRSYLSLTSSLNMQHSQDLGIRERTPKKDVYGLLKNHRVQEFLKSQGYEYYHISNWYPPTARNPNADTAANGHLDLIRDNLNRFSIITLENTAMRALLHMTKVPKPKAVNKNFNGLKQASEDEGQKFVFAHLLMPHGSFELGPNGSSINYEEETPRSEKYTNQLQATNKFLNETVEEILSNENKSNTVIIMQSDEGPGEQYWDWSEINESKKREKAAILNAVYAPGMNESKFYPRMTPVNTFRIIFNEYFGSNLSLQEDKVYLKKRKKGHDLLEVEDDVLYPTR